MFEALNEQPADKILALVAAYKADPREAKIDLGVGVYRNAEGQTPVMRAVKTAEKRLWDIEATKSYVGLAGDPGFADVMIHMILGDAVPRNQIAAAATPGGTGAVRQAFDLALMAKRDVRIFVSDPTWPNHLSILKHMKIETIPYRYFDAETRGVDFEGMMADLSVAKAGDLVLLHGCCHNPTGANLNLSQWKEVSALLQLTQMKKAKKELEGAPTSAASRTRRPKHPDHHALGPSGHGHAHALQGSAKVKALQGGAKVKAKQEREHGQPPSPRLRSG